MNSAIVRFSGEILRGCFFRKQRPMIEPVTELVLDPGIAGRGCSGSSELQAEAFPQRNVPFTLVFT
jgi:hypothetical protein